MFQLTFTVNGTNLVFPKNTENIVAYTADGLALKDLAGRSRDDQSKFLAKALSSMVNAPSDDALNTEVSKMWDDVHTIGSVLEQTSPEEESTYM